MRPEGDDLIGRLVRESTAHFYASQSWLARNGRPESVEDIAPANVIGFEETERFTELMRGVGVRVTEDGFPLISENAVVVWEMVKRGLGIGLMSREIAQRTDGVVELFPDSRRMSFRVWLVTHRELRTSRRIRLVYEILAEELARVDCSADAFERA